jgi:hypothetical protein
VSKKKTGQFKVYFEDNGDMMYCEPYVNRWATQQPGYVPAQHKTEDNHIFHDIMEYTRWYGNVITFRSTISGRKYHMSLRHFDEMMKAKRMTDNVIEGNFTFCKHGMTQGCKMILPKPAPLTGNL